MSKLQIETFEKCSILFKFKEGENFNRRNILNISRIALKLHCVPKFEPDADTLVKLYSANWAKGGVFQMSQIIMRGNL